LPVAKEAESAEAMFGYRRETLLQIRDLARRALVVKLH
jgi:hypothetical protein